MALQNEILVGRFNRALQKLLSIKGPPPAATIGGDIQPELLLEDLGVEARYITGWDRFILRAGVVGGAGQLAATIFRNPAASATIAVIEKLVHSFQQNDQIFGSIRTVGAGADGTPISLTQAAIDHRGRPSTGMVISTTPNFGAFGITQYSIRGLAFTNYDSVITENQEVTILPGDALVLGSQTVAAVMDTTFIWRERFLEESERT